MFPRLVFLVVCLCLPFAAPQGQAQSFDATNLRQPTDLDAIWLVHAGDDPAYARKDFDDSAWARFHSTGSIRTVFPDSHPEVVWYRLHVKVLPSQTGLALAEWNIASAFEVYVNGQRLMQCGRVVPFAAYTYSARLLEPIPDREIAAGSVVIALRVHISKLEWGDQGAGFIATNLSIGQEQALSDHIWLQIIGQYGPGLIANFLGLGLGIVALVLFSSQRRQWEYLWIFLQFFYAFCRLPLNTYEYFHNLPANWDLLREPLAIATLLFTCLMYFAFLRLRFGRWMQTAFIVAILGWTLSMIGQAHGNISRIASVLAQFPILILIAGVIPVLLIVHWRRGNREAGILLIPVILQSLTYYASILLFFLGLVPAFQDASTKAYKLLFAWQLGPFNWDLGQLANLLYLLSLAIIMVLRSTRISRQQALLEGEMAAAREVQQIILPEQADTVIGFTVESVYQPAQQVGGDFFQVLPTEQGGLLLVVGDVAGKGLPAAMLVSVLVGAIRGVAEYTIDPANMLANLNDRLIGRTSGTFSTALVAHIAANGIVKIANAGHLSPYLDGREIELPGALPLGIQPHAHYETIQFHLAPGSRLTFYSDGVVEAQNAKRELFGFERGRELSTRPAAAIVKAAQEFGQADDITVVTIERAAALATAA
ncbi:MAG: SpoIIE family protein phosphatase [Terracidiphilus sp.]